MRRSVACNAHQLQQAYLPSSILSNIPIRMLQLLDINWTQFDLTKHAWHVSNTFNAVSTKYFGYPGRTILHDLLWWRRHLIGPIAWSVRSWPYQGPLHARKKGHSICPWIWDHSWSPLSLHFLVYANVCTQNFSMPTSTSRGDPTSVDPISSPPTTYINRGAPSLVFA